MIRTVAAFLLLSSSLLAFPPLPNGRTTGQKQIATFVYPKGLRVELWAADPMLASPVAICLDEQNRIYVAEEYRFNQGTEENRTRPFLLDDDLQINTVEERLAMYRKWAHKFDGGMDWFRRYSDQVRLLEDREGDGRADRSTIFATGFNDPLDGLAAGLIARDGDVYFTCIPHLWRLRDTNGDGQADVRESLHRGFGVNCAFLGHDLHGLVWGPDGRLYFSVGDRGFHVVTKEGVTLHGPRTGAVFRCEPDGSNLEVIHRGLRNPQELAFDQFGNLFAVDNNCDKGDHARLVYVVEGGDSGWNMAYQTIPEPYLTGPWHAERLWHLHHAGQPAWIVPPVGKLGAGPSGFVFTSGLSLPDRYRNRFFYCNYTGRGGIESFGVTPQGAGFTMVDHHDFLKPIMATDVDFGYDGKMYVADFVNLLWNGGSAGGRIYTVVDPERIDQPVVRETKQLFATGFRQRSETELAQLLSHPDQRVRLRAQFTLAERGETELPWFQQTLKQSTNQLARLHAVWGIGQLARRYSTCAPALAPYLRDQDAEVRAQTARVIGDCRWSGAKDSLIALLQDENARVRFFAVQALGQLRHRPAIAPIVAMLKENDNRDPLLRHAGVAALANIGDAEAIQTYARSESPAVRLAVLLVQRRLQDHRMVQFLNDAEFSIVVEAARAIHDLPMDDELPALAALLERQAANPAPDTQALLRRAIHAHFRIGTPASAQAVASFAADKRAPLAMRSEAIAALAEWIEPPPRDRVTGFWRPLPKRDPGPIREAVEPIIPMLLASADGKLLTDIVGLVGRLNLKADEQTVLTWIADPKRPLDMRRAALRLLAVRGSGVLDQAIETAQRDPQMKDEANLVEIEFRPERAMPLIQNIILGEGSIHVRQRALALLPKVPNNQPALHVLSERLSRNRVPPELLLDWLECLRESPAGPWKKSLEDWENRNPKSNLLATFRPALYGGNAERGRALFVSHAGAQCIRCHRVHGSGGDAGPDLTKLVQRHPTTTREYLLESLLVPSAKIADGFATVALTLTDGKVIAGLIKAEDARSVTLMLPDGSMRTISKEQIEDRSKPQSAMPEMGKVLTPREARDLIEYLMTLK